MANGKDTTTKFKVDISELKASMQEAKRQVRLANAEFKAATAGMDRWSESADGLSAKMTQLHKTLSSQKTQLAVLEQEYAQVAAEQGKSSKAAQELLIKINNQKAAIGKTKSDLEHYGRALNDLQTGSKAAADGTTEFVSASAKLQSEISTQETELKQLKQAYSDVVLEQGKTSTEALQLAGDIDKLSSELQSNKSKLSDAQYEAEDLGDSLDDAGDGAESAADGFTVMKGAIADLVANGIRWCIDELKNLASEGEDAMDKFQASTGTSTTAMSGLKKEILDLYKNNFGESISDVADAMAEVKQQTGEIDPSKLKELTQNAIVLRDTFGFDVKESMRAVNMLMEQFGITSDEAFNLVVQGAQNGLDKNGDLLDSINEYAVHYKQMGVTAEGFFNSLENGSKAGTFSVDKLGDAYKEFGIRVKDTATTTDEAYQILGLDADEMRAQFAKGGDSAANATKVVLSKLMTMDDQVKQNQAGVDLFGTMWEDLGIEGVKALTNVTGSADQTKKSMAEINKQRYDNAVSQLKTIGRSFKIDVLQPLVAEVLPHLVDFAQWFSKNTPAIVGSLAAIGTALLIFNIGSIVAAATSAIGTLTTAIGLLGLAISANPIGALASVVGAVVVGITAYTAATKKATGETDSNLQMTNALISAQKDLNDALKQTKKSRDENVSSAQAEGKQADFYYDKLSALIGVEKKSASQKAQIKAYVDKLNEIMPNLNLQYDEEKDKLNMSTDAIRKNIAAQKDLILAKAAQANMESIAADIADLEIKQGEIIKQNTANEKAYLKAQGETVKAREAYIKSGYNNSSQEYKNYQQALQNENKKKEAYEKTNAAVDKNKKKLQELNTEYNNTDKYAQEKINSAEIEQGLSAITEKMKAKGKQIPEAIAQGIREGQYVVPTTVKGMNNLISFQEAAAKANLEGVKIPQSLADGISSGKVAADEAVKALQKVAEFDQSTSVKMAKSAGVKIPQSLREGIASGKITVEQATKTINESVSNNLGVKNAGTKGKKVGKDYADGVKSNSSNAKKSGESLGKNTKTGADSGAKGIKDTGVKRGLEFNKGVESKKSSAKTSGSALGKAAKTGASSGANGMKSEGSKRAGEFTSGVSSKKGTAKTTGKSVGTAAKSGVKEGSSGTNEIGKNIVEGVKKGADDNSGSLFTKMKNIAKSALRAAEKAIGINSPSRAFRDQVGKQIIAGIIVGMKNEENALLSSMKNTMKSVLKTAVNVTNGQFTTAGTTATQAFSDVIQKQLNLASERLAYTYQQELSNYDTLISQYDAAIENRTSAVSDYQKSQSQVQSAISAADKEIENLQKKRDQAIANLKKSKEYKNASKSNKKNMVNDITHYYTAQINAVKKNRDELKQELSYWTQLIDTTNVDQATLKATQESVKTAQENFKTASDKAIASFTEAMSDFGTKAQQVVSDTINGITEKYQEDWNDLVSLQDSMTSKLKNFGDLFEISGAGIMTVNDITKQTEDIKSYMQSLNDIKGKVSQDLFNQIATYDVEQGKAFMDRLLAMSDSELAAYDSAYREKMKASEELSQSLYQTDFKMVSAAYNREMNAAFKDLPAQLQEIGVECMKGFTTGLTTDTGYMTKAVQDVANSIIEEFKKALQIHSPSKVMEKMGQYLVEGLGDGIVENLRYARDAVTKLADTVSIPSADISGTVKQAKNSLQNAVQGGGVVNNNVVNNYNLTQNNTSPKAINALEAYRNQKKMIAMLKVAKA